MARAGLPPDAWQGNVLRAAVTAPARPMILLACRQAGKSTVVAALAVLTAVLEPPAEVLILSRTQRQSSELFRKVKGLYRALGGRRPARNVRWQPPVPLRELDRAELLGPAEQVERETAMQLELANGSRVVSLPGSADSVVGFSGVSLLVIDEAARVHDDLYRSVRPMLARSKGRLVLLSTPLGKRGFFYEEWQRCEDAKRSGRPPAFEAVKVTADQCAWLDPAFLRREEQSIGARWFRQDYMCSFEEATDSVFSPDDIAAALSDEVLPLGTGSVFGRSEA
jgi:hypothetical protein